MKTECDICGIEYKTEYFPRWENDDSGECYCQYCRQTREMFFEEDKTICRHINRMFNVLEQRIIEKLTSS
jgi:hypothetical protein